MPQAYHRFPSILLVLAWLLAAPPLALQPAGAAGLTCAQLAPDQTLDPASSWGTIKRVHTDSSRAPRPVASDDGLTVAALKWLHGHRAAVSLTYDGAYYWGQHLVPVIKSHGVPLDYECVTYYHETDDRLKATLPAMRSLLEEGQIHFFGHGHKHDLHDDFAEDYVRSSFSTCFELMQQWGLRPKAYAYPGSAGTKAYVQAANRDAGFICARGDDRLDWDNYYILAGDQTEPDNWYFLPSVVMGTTYPSMVESHQELLPIMQRNLREGAWTILMYHAVGMPEGWGYYPLPEFERNLEWLTRNDVWVTHLDQCCAYIQERARLEVTVTPVERTSLCQSYDVVLEDGLDDTVYDQELSLELRLPAAQAEYGRIVVERGEQAVDLDVGAEKLYVNGVPDGQGFRVFLVRQPGPAAP